MDWLWIAPAFAAGWWLHGLLDRTLLRIAIRIMSSAAGKRRILEAIRNGIEKLEQPR